jgi:hypothetical protein
MGWLQSVQPLFLEKGVLQTTFLSGNIGRNDNERNIGSLHEVLSDFSHCCSSHSAKLRKHTGNLATRVAQLVLELTISNAGIKAAYSALQLCVLWG